MAFRRADQMPEEECRKLKIFIAKKQQAVVLPVYGMSVPFHIAHIKNISKVSARVPAKEKENEEEEEERKVQKHGCVSRWMPSFVL